MVSPNGASTASARPSPSDPGRAPANQSWAQLAAVRTSRLAERDGGVVSSSIEVFFESRDGEGRRAPQ